MLAGPVCGLEPEVAEELRPPDLPLVEELRSRCGPLLLRQRLVLLGAPAAILQMF